MLNIMQEYSNHLKEIFENSYDYIYIHDKMGNIIDVNDMVLRNLGYTKEEILDMKVTDFLVEEIVSDVSIAIKETMDTGIVNKTKTYKVRKKDGNFIYVESNAIPLKKDGQIYAILGIGHDITEFKEVELKISESELKLKEKNDELSALNKLISLGNESMDLQEFLKKSYDQVLDIVGFDRGGVYLYNPETQHNVLVLHKNVHPDFITAVEDVDISKDLFSKVFDKIKPYYIEDFSEFMENSKKLGVYSAIIVPLRSKDKYVGSLNIASPVHQGLSQNKLELLVAIGKQMGIIIQKFKSEKLLKESEEKFRTLSEQSMMGIGILQDYELKYANNRLASILGLVKEEMKGIDFQGLLQMIHPEDREKVIKQVQRRKDRTQDTITFYHFRAFKKTGELVWVEVYSKIIKYQGERASLLTFLDITDMKMAELKLIESEEKFRTLFEKANDGILLADNETGQIFTGNIKICEMLGYTLEELKNKSFGDLHTKESLSYIDEQFEEEQSEIVPDVNDIPMKRKDGSIFYCNVNSSKIELAGTSYFMGIFRDITERKNAEQKLKESEEKFRNIAEQSFMGIVIVQKGVFKYMNKAMSKISGYSIEEMLTWSSKEMVQMIHPEDVKLILKRLQSNIDSNMGPFSSNAFRIINKNGEVRWLEDYTTRIIYQGEQANLISVIDITDRKEAEQLIIEENRRLLELHELRKDLITRVSHELKTPMTSIYGANQILIKLYMDQIGEEAQKYIEIGHRGSLRLKQLIDNLLDISRLDAKRIDLKLQKENLIDLLIDTVKDMNYLATNRQLKMKLDLPNEAYIEIDRLRFRQVLSNIILNAIKNTPKEGEILINLLEKTEYVDIQVKDTGVGITEKEKEKLFEKFGKIERYGMDLGVDIEGSGLGLYISKEIVELHGGQILMESEGRNKGTTFTIRLFKK